MGLEASCEGGSLGALAEDWRAERRGVADCELRCLRCEGDDMIANAICEGVKNEKASKPGLQGVMKVVTNTWEKAPTRGKGAGRVASGTMAGHA